MKLATRESYAKALIELGKINEDIVVLDADLSKATKTCEFNKYYSDRFFNIGIAEQNLMGMSAGMSQGGKIPFATTFAVFATGRAYEVIRNSICYPKANVKIAATHAGITVGPDGGTHQAVEDIALMTSLPNMTVLVPADDKETREAVKAAAKMNGPVYIRLGRIAMDDIYDENYKFEIGKGTVLREGSDVAIVATGIMVNKALKAHDILKKQGINARVINMSTIKPLDKEIIIKAAKETKGIVTVEEHSIYGGLGSIVSTVITEEAPTIVKKVAIQDTFGESGNPDELLVKYGLTENDIIQKVKDIINY